MKIHFINAEKIIDAVELVKNDLEIIISDKKTADITVTVEEVNDFKLETVIDGKEAKIVWGGGRATFLRGLAMIIFAVRSGQTKREVSEAPIFTLNGAMVDMSRNAVMNVKTVKYMLRKMALMGQNAFMLYTEDTYEIEGRPYFGYMRGRYTKEELRELDAYAMTLGIELIPCIQTLGHLSTMLKWSCTAPYKDTQSCMLVGSEETYRLIEDMLNTISQCFTTKRIHIGMDETGGLGTGAYLAKNGYREECKIYLEHLDRVTKMCKSHGFEPMMWSDMIILLSGSAKDVYDPDAVITDEYASSIPDGMQQVFWDYYNISESFYDKNISNHQKIDKNTMFAGGIWTWSGHCPLFTRSFGYSIAALNSCKKCGVKEVIATIWHNGSEANLITSIAGLAWYADYGYKAEYNEQSVKECFAFSTGESYDDFMKLQLPDQVDGGKLSISRSLLYNDPLCGLIDAHLKGIETDNYYRTVTNILMQTKPNSQMIAPAFDVITKLSSLLENKASFGIRLKAAYDSGDREQMKKMAEECDIIQEKLLKLRLSHRNAWMQYNKPLGWEVHDIRYGGISARIDTAKHRILSYLDGDISMIEELHEERLRIDCGAADAPAFNNSFLWRGYYSIATVNII